MLRTVLDQLVAQLFVPAELPAEIALWGYGRQLGCAFLLLLIE